MRKTMASNGGAILGAMLLMVALATPVLADGSEDLGSPFPLVLANGTGFATGGIGLTMTQPGTLNVAVPAMAQVKQILIYWEGQERDPGLPDDSIVVSGIPVTGTLIGGPTFFFEDARRRDPTRYAGRVAEARDDVIALGVRGALLRTRAGRDHGWRVARSSVESCSRARAYSGFARSASA